MDVVGCGGFCGDRGGLGLVPTPAHDLEQTLR